MANNAAAVVKTPCLACCRWSCSASPSSSTACWMRMRSLCTWTATSLWVRRSPLQAPACRVAHCTISGMLQSACIKGDALSGTRWESVCRAQVDVQCQVQ